MTEARDTPDSADSSRASYLLDGRRVRVHDLLKHGLLRAGECLTFTRPRLGETHKATVTDRGWLRLENGEEVRSPSRAAMIAVGSGGAFDGWHAWALPDGRTLNQLRQELLDSSATQISGRFTRGSAPEPSDLSLSAADRHDRLRDAARRAEVGDPVSVTVQELLSWWGAAGRGTVNDRIDADLANHGLTTSPGFDKVPLTTTVELVKEAVEDDREGGTAFNLKVGQPADETSPETGLTIGTLPSALGRGVVSVKPTATFEEAITLMTLHDFSQLPVLTSPHNLRGAVSWRSIARARHADPEASFSQAVFDPREVRYDHDLIDVLPMLAESDFVLVRDQHNKIAGIVTAADVAQAYGDLASHFLLIGEMDRRLRQIISGSFTLEEVKAACGTDGERLTTFGEMTVGHYQRVLGNPGCWSQLGWPLDRKVFVEWLDEVRKIRNNVMHFNSSDPLPKADVDKIRNLNRLLRDYGE
jgi:CBS domain-containing protein